MICRALFFIKMKNYLVFLIFLASLLLCSCSEPTEILDKYYKQKNELELQLKESSLSEKEYDTVLGKIETVQNKIDNAISVFAVKLIPDSLDIESVPYASDDISKIGEWYYNNIIYPLFCYESDYASLSINKEENFTSQEKFYILSYHLLQKYNDLLTEKYSYLSVSEESMSRLSFAFFGEDIDSSSVMQYSSKTKRYSIPFSSKDERLLVPIYNGVKLKDVTKTEITVNYAERSLSKAIYSETFVFERSEDNVFKLYSRVRNNQSFSLIGSSASNIPDEDVYVLELPIVYPENIQEDNLKLKGQLLSSHYGQLIDNYNGTICRYDKLSVSALINMFLLMHDNIDAIISELNGEYEFLGIPIDYLEKQASLFFKNSSLDFSSNALYHDSLDVFLFKISDISKITYNKQVLDILELENGCIRLETALFDPSNFIQLIAKEVVILEPKSDGTYYILSRHYNLHTASSINSIIADIVPSFPESYPDTSSSDTVKGTWLYKNYDKLLKFEFSSTDGLSSEKLATFALERLFETEDFKSLAKQSNCIAFPKSLIEEQIRLYFGDTNFVSEYVSYYDYNTEYFYVNPWKVNYKETSGSVVRAGCSDENIFTVYIESKKTDDRMRPSQYVLTFYELENESFRFVSAVTID